MRLSDARYRALVRVGILIVVFAIFAFDRLPPTFQPMIIALAAIGAVLGFFPLFTSNPFHSSEEDESRALEVEARRDREESDLELRKMKADLDRATTVPICSQTLEVNAYKVLVESYIHDFYTRLRPTLTTHKQYFRVYDIDHIDLGFSSYAGSSFADRNVRSARVKEVHDLIDKLRGTPQTFSVELTSSDSIIVHCEGQSQSSMNLDEYEKDILNFDEPSDSPMRSIQ